MLRVGAEGMRLAILLAIGYNGIEQNDKSSKSTKGDVLILR